MHGTTKEVASTYWSPRPAPLCTSVTARRSSAANRSRRHSLVEVVICRSAHPALVLLLFDQAHMEKQIRQQLGERRVICRRNVCSSDVVDCLNRSGHAVDVHGSLRFASCEQEATFPGHSQA